MSNYRPNNQQRWNNGPAQVRAPQPVPALKVPDSFVEDAEKVMINMVI